MKFKTMLIALVFYHCTMASTLYWIGDTPAWDDKDHWSLAQNGSSCSCVPGPTDDVEITSPSQIQVLINDGDHVSIRSLIISSFNELYVGNVGMPSASLIINNPLGTGLQVSGDLIVRDSLSVHGGNNTAVSISPNGLFTVKQGGRVLVEGSNTLNGLRNNGQFVVEGDGITFGKVIIKTMLAYGLNNLDYVENSGVIEIRQINYPDNFPNGIDNSGELINSKYGNIIIDSIDVDGNGSGINSHSKVVNKGHIQISNTGNRGMSISNDTTLNEGNITVSDFKGSAFAVIVNGVLYNEGTLEAFTDHANNTQGLTNTGTVLNQESGVFYLHDLGNFFYNYGINNSKSITNHGFISIENIAGTGIRSISANSAFTTGGHISIITMTLRYLEVDHHFEVLSDGIVEVSLN